MLNKFLLTVLALMLSHTTVYAWVDCDKKGGCIPDAIFTIDGIDQLKARVLVGNILGITKPQECIPIDWVGTCKIENLGGPGNYYAEVSFGVTARLDGFHCDYYGRIDNFYFGGLYQVVKKIPLRGNCYYFDDELPPAKE